MYPINFKQWLDENRDLLKPPVGNKLIFEDSQFIVMAVAGPNQRSDFHVSVSDEIFYQVEGDMVLRIIEDGQFKDINIAQGEMFLLSSNTPHSPQRFANTVGIVIERTRKPDELDGFQWYCDNCMTKLYEEYLHVDDIVKQLPPVFDRFFSDIKNTTCPSCGVQKVR